MVIKRPVSIKELDCDHGMGNVECWYILDADGNMVIDAGYEELAQELMEIINDSKL